MKARVQTPSELLRQIDELLGAKHASALYALDQLAELLATQARYEWVGIYLSAGSGSEPVVSSPFEGGRAVSRHVVMIKLATRTLGAIEVTSLRPNAFSYKDRVLLKQIAARVARYLESKGKPLMRKLRAAAKESSVPAKRQPESERAAVRGAAASSSSQNPQMRRAAGASSPRA